MSLYVSPRSVGRSSVHIFSMALISVALTASCQEEKTALKINTPITVTTVEAASPNEPHTVSQAIIPSEVQDQQTLLQEKLKLSRDILSLDGISKLSQIAARERWGDGHTLRVGPIPDYAPLSRVYAHQQLMGLAPETSSLLTESLQELLDTEDYDPGEQLEGDPFIEDTMLLWMRDYHPIYVRKKSGELAAIHYLSHNPNRARYAIKQDISADQVAALIEPKSAEERLMIKQLLAKREGQRKVDLHEQLPLLHENGNLIIVGPWVFMSDRLLEDNSTLESAEHLIEGGFMPRGRAGVLHELSRALEVPKSRIVILPSLPHEATGHVDLYLMALNDHQVVIPKVVIPMDLLSANMVERSIAEEVATFLDDRAEQLANLGLDVIRMPQLPPLYLPALDEPPGQFDVVIYSPTNGLLINHGGVQRIMLPHAELFDLRPELKALSDSYETYWYEAFQLLGWTPTMIEATTLGRYLGLIHCVTAATPKLPLQTEWQAAIKARQEKELYLTSSPQKAMIPDHTISPSSSDLLMDLHQGGEEQRHGPNTPANRSSRLDIDPSNKQPMAAPQ